MAYTLAVGRRRGRGKTGLLGNLRRFGRALGRAGYFALPEELAAVGVEGIHLATIFRGPSQKHPIVPDHRRIVSR